MPLQPPNLDDRRFAQIFEEARGLIPRYLPEWTDHNESDPGITLLQLFSWLGEMILYRLNRVPERNYIKFLQLIGVEQKPAVPAHAELTFKLVSPDLAPVVVPQRTRVAAEVKPPPPSVVAPPLLAPQDEEPVIFETDEPLIALGAVLQEVQVFDGINYVVYSASNNTPGEHYPAFGRNAREGSAVLLGFASNSPFPALELNLTCRLYADPEQVAATSCDLPETQFYPPATLAWEYWDGGQWRGMDVLKDETRAFSRSGHIYLRVPKGVTKDKIGRISDQDLYWLRGRLATSQYERPPELDALLTNTVQATAVVTVQNEVAGSSNGQPNQQFTLRNAPLYAGPPRSEDERLREQASRQSPPTEAEQAVLDQQLRERELEKGFLLEVDEGQGPKPWEEVEDFFNSGPEDAHYVLNRTTGQVYMGDGEQGRIPLAGINNIIARFYRYGGGKRGNVGSLTITSLQTAVGRVDSVTNNWMAEGGSDEEPVEDTKARAPKELKARDRAVTLQDFEFLARQTPGVRVRRAHALPLYHPQFPDVQVPGTITVIVVPESDDPKPIPSEGTLQTVCAYLNQRRLLTAEVFVAPPRYKQVKVVASVLARSIANPAEVKTLIEQALTTYLHPLTGGADGQGWPLGGDVLYSEVFRQVLSVDGVQSIQDLRIIVDGEGQGRCEDAIIPDDFLVYSDGHDIQVAFTPAG
jgi:predicted phage baseplate assembly protein